MNSNQIGSKRVRFNNAQNPHQREPAQDILTARLAELDRKMWREEPKIKILEDPAPKQQPQNDEHEEVKLGKRDRDNKRVPVGSLDVENQRAKCSEDLMSRTVMFEIPDAGRYSGYYRKDHGGYCHDRK